MSLLAEIDVVCMTKYLHGHTKFYQKTLETRIMAIGRRTFLKAGAALTLTSCNHFPKPDQSRGVLVNDIHSALNPTLVHAIENITSLQSLRGSIARAGRDGRGISIAGGRHAMGAQQFATGSVLLDTRSLSRIHRLDRRDGLVTVESGIQWPALVHGLIQMQEGEKAQWGIRQKQTGADHLSIGGALGANVHGRGLLMKPFVDDVESFELVNANGELVTCSRTQNKDLFGLVIGGYGMFGMIYTVTLRLNRRHKLERVVDRIDLEEFMPKIEERIKDGFTFGDFQYDTDEGSDTFMRQGVFSCYKPVSDTVRVPSDNKEMSHENWLELIHLAHTNRRKAFQEYCSYYLKTNGQVYWSDTHQMSIYIACYRNYVSEKTKGKIPTSLMISELYAPRERLTEFMLGARDILRISKTPVIYGTVRLIEKDDETFLPWARERYACVIFNLLVEHTPEGKKKAAESFRSLIDHSISMGGELLPYLSQVGPEGPGHRRVPGDAGVHSSKTGL
ncbi:MAG: hypothetical protein CMJ20_06215 [Phycisphaeraceae bacterium]|nr:hypothetical protein [Phycisphaeraceae bacterium]